MTSVLHLGLKTEVLTRIGKDILTFPIHGLYQILSHHFLKLLLSRIQSPRVRGPISNHGLTDVILVVPENNLYV